MIRKDKYGKRRGDLELYVKEDLDYTDGKKQEPHIGRLCL